MAPRRAALIAFSLVATLFAAAGLIAQTSYRGGHAWAAGDAWPAAAVMGSLFGVIAALIVYVRLRLRERNRVR